MATFDPAALTAFENLLRLIESIPDAAERVKKLKEAFSELNASQLEQIQASITTSAEIDREISARTRHLDIVNLSAEAQLRLAEADRDAARRSGDKIRTIEAEQEAREALIEKLKVSPSQ